MKDQLMQVKTLASTPNPQTVCYLAMHQDYSSNPVGASDITRLNEQRCGVMVVERCLRYGHWGVIEHPSITLNCQYVPHSTVMQFRTHRLATFDVQSFRYTSESITSIDSQEKLEQAFYFRPVGYYTDRSGKRYNYSVEERNSDIALAENAIARYKSKIQSGFSEEHARDCLPSNYRQHFVMSVNLRSALHILNLRRKADAQLECQWLSDAIYERLLEWAPEIVGWYNSSHKKHLAP